MSEQPDTASEMDGPSELLLEAAVDDLSPEYFEPLVERLLELGALDVQQVPYTGVAGRKGTLVRALIPTAARSEAEDILMLHSSTTQVIALPVDRVEARIELRAVTTRWGDVRLRLKIWRGQVIESKPLPQDTADVARDAGAPYGLVHGEAMRLGDVFIGQKI